MQERLINFKGAVDIGGSELGDTGMEGERCRAGRSVWDATGAGGRKQGAGRQPRGEVVAIQAKSKRLITISNKDLRSACAWPSQGLLQGSVAYRVQAA